MRRRTERPTPLVALLLAALLPSPEASGADLDGDGAADLVFRATDAPGTRLLVLAGGAALRIQLAPAGGERQPVDVRTGSFDRSARDGVLTRNLLTGETRLWRQDEDGSFAARPLPGLPTGDGHRIEAVADFDGDDRDDLLLRNEASGERAVYRIRAGTVDAAGSGPIGIDGRAQEQFVAAADFDGDRRADLLVRDTLTLAWTLHLLDGPLVLGTQQPALPLNPVWQLEGTADMDRDGRLDLLFRRTDTGEWRLWFMNGAQASPISGTVSLPRDPAWRLSLLGDLDGDGNGDVLLRHADTGELYAAYLIQRGLRSDSGPVALTAEHSSRPAGAGDFNGDGAAEVLLADAAGAWRVADLSRPGTPAIRELETGNQTALALACPPPARADFRLPPPDDDVRPDAVLITWSRPATRTNGEGLCAHDLAGFRISAWRQGSTAYRDVDIPDSGQRRYLVTGLGPGTWRFAVRAYDADGRVGPFSELRSKAIRRSTGEP